MKSKSKFLKDIYAGNAEKKNDGAQLDERLSCSLDENILKIRTITLNTSDLIIRELFVSRIRTALIMCEGMVSSTEMTLGLVDPLTGLDMGETGDPQMLIRWMENYALLAADKIEIFTVGDVIRLIMSGFVVSIIDGADKAVAFGLQGYQYRSISEPSAEVNERGSREGFIENIRVNMSMVRRRMKSPSLKFELFSSRGASKTDICMVYMKDTVSKKLAQKIRYAIKNAPLEAILDSAYLAPFVEDRPLSLFSAVGYTERPDTVCAKVSEGRIGVFVDGSPFCMIVPFLFTENFQTMDDYTHRPYYATFIRWLKYFSFIITILLPGAYVAIATFHPEMFPRALLFNVAESIEKTPFPIFGEALIIMIVYEIMREAGLRLPRPVGHAVSIIGGLVIGDAAVKAGLIGSPMIMVVAITAISSFVLPQLYQSVTILRLSFIVLGGVAGLYGLAVGSMAVLINICAVKNNGVPYTAPIAPFSLPAMRDVATRLSWKRLAKQRFVLQKMPGAHISKEEEQY